MRGHQAHHYLLLPIQRPPARRPLCEWSADEEERLIQFLLTCSTAAADGGNFKPVTWNAAMVEMAKVPTKGPNKMAKACASKMVRYVYIYSSFETTTENWLASSTIQTS